MVTTELQEKADAHQFALGNCYDYAKAADRRIAELERQIEQDTFCAYCGHKYPRSTPKSGNELLTGHIRQCPKHPMRKLEQRLAEMQERIDWLEKERAACMDVPS